MINGIFLNRTFPHWEVNQYLWIGDNILDTDGFISFKSSCRAELLPEKCLSMTLVYCLMLPPGMLEGFVVAGEPLLGSDHTAIDVVANQVVEMFGRLPLDKNGRLGVPGGDDLARSRRDTCRSEN